MEIFLITSTTLICHFQNHITWKHCNIFSYYCLKKQRYKQEDVHENCNYEQVLLFLKTDPLDTCTQIYCLLIIT